MMVVLQFSYNFDVENSDFKSKDGTCYSEGCREGSNSGQEGISTFTPMSFPLNATKSPGKNTCSSYLRTLKNKW